MKKTIILLSILIFTISATYFVNNRDLKEVDLTRNDFIYSDTVIRQLNEDEYKQLTEINEGAIVLIGDSITKGFKPFTDQYENVVNRGISGIRTYEVYNSLDEIYFNAMDTSKVETVVIAVGTNDVNDNLDNQQRLDLLNQIVTKIYNDNKNVDIIVNAVYPVNSNVESSFFVDGQGSRNNDDIIEYNSFVEEGLIKKAQFINLREYLIDIEGNLKMEYTYDGLHLTDSGYEQLLDVYFEDLFNN